MRVRCTRSRVGLTPVKAKAGDSRENDRTPGFHYDTVPPRSKDFRRGFDYRHRNEWRGHDPAEYAHFFY